MLESIKKNWATILLALISSTFLADLAGFIQVTKTLNQVEVSSIIKEIKESRDFYKSAYVSCNNDIIKTKSDVAILKSNIQILGAIDTDIPLPIWLKDLEGRFLFVNYEYEKLFLHNLGITKEQAIGKTDYELLEKSVARNRRHSDQLAYASESPIVVEQEYSVAGKPGVWRVVKYKRKLGNSVIGIGGYATKLR